MRRYFFGRVNWRPPLILFFLLAVMGCASDSKFLDGDPPPIIIPAAQVTVESKLRSAMPAADTPTPKPRTNRPLPSPIPQPTPVPTKTNPELIGPDNFPLDVNPLTGERVADPTVLQRRPIAIKISNIAKVRPQAGLGDADLVFEHYSEAGITRFTAIFYANNVDRVGSIRSGRLIDLEIPLMYDAAFAYSGSSSPIRQMIRDSLFIDRVISPDFAHGGFERIFDDRNPSSSYVDSLFTDTHTLHWILHQRNQDNPPDFQTNLSFQTKPPEGGSPATGIELFYKATNVFWGYNPSLDSYARWSDGVVHVDANNGKQLNFDNIIVIYVPHFNTEIEEDTGGSPSIQIQLWGEGPAIIFRNGVRYDGSWHRENRNDMITFTDLDNKSLPLAPGKTFIQIVPDDFTGLIVNP